MSAKEARTFDPASPEFVQNPYPAYLRLRKMAPLFKTPGGFWLATKFDVVNAVLRDKRFGIGYEARTKRGQGDDIFEVPVFNSMRRMMVLQNPPNHTRIRGLVARIFTHRRIEALRPRIRYIVDELIDAVEPKGEMYVVRDFAYPLPVEVICDMLGMPVEDRGRFYGGSGKSNRLLDPTPLTPEEIEQTNKYHLELAAYFRGLVNERRKSPREDLLTVMAEANEDGDRLTDDELIANVILMFVAGHETVSNQIGNGLFALLSTPGQLEALRADPSLIKGAVEEMLRFDTSVQMTARAALEDVELNGKKIAKGEGVIVVLGSANRDAGEFSDPDHFDVTRQGAHPTSFGGGIHHCLGAQLARVELQIAFETLLRRLPNMRFLSLDGPRFKQTYTLRGLVDLPIGF